MFICLTGEVAWAQDEAFMRHCGNTMGYALSQLPKDVSVSSICQCQADKLRTAGITPDQVDGLLTQEILQTMPDELGNAPNQRQASAARKDMMRIMKAQTDAITGCMPNKAADSMNAAIAALRKRNTGAK